MHPTTLDQEFEIAFRHHQANRLSVAESLYRRILAKNPQYSDALHYSGVIAYQTGRFPEALELIERALAVDPNSQEAHNNYGNVLRDSGRLAEAIRSFRRAVDLDGAFHEAAINLGNAHMAVGQYHEAIIAFRQAMIHAADQAMLHNNLGLALKNVGKTDQALAAFRQAVELDPGLSEGHNNLGNLLQRKGQSDEAIVAFHCALRARPEYPEALSNLAIALRDKGRFDESAVALRKAISLKPDYAGAFNNLAIVLRDKGLLEESIEACRRSIELRPHSSEAYHNLGLALTDRGLAAEAVGAARTAIRLSPAFAEAHNGLGLALAELGLLDDAIDAFKQAISLDPNNCNACNNLGNVLKSAGDLDSAIESYRRAVAMKPGYLEAESNLLFSLYYHPNMSALAIAEEHRRWNRRYTHPRSSSLPTPANDRNPNRRLRIGYVSGDLGNHPVGWFLLPLVSNHDREQFDILCYAQSPRIDAFTQKLRTHFDTWRDIVGVSDESAAQMIRDDEIDILVDLSMHSARNRLLIFAQKPAPVQVTYLAYAGSSGLTAVDYRLSDPYLDPLASNVSVYSETTMRLPETFWCYSPIVDLPVGESPAIKNGYVTLGCLNNFSKVNEPLLDLWAKIMKSAPTTRLILHALEGSHRQRLRDHFQRRGIDPGRVEIVGRMPTPAYFQQYHAIDIHLDTHPYGGGTTTFDALWMGVPVVSLVGGTAVGRAGLSILSNLGLAELAANTRDEYVHIALDLCGDLSRLNRVRATLRQRMQASPLMATTRFARNIEAAYRQMWQRWCSRRSGD